MHHGLRRFEDRPSHPLTRVFKRVVITDALRRALQTGARQVTIAWTPSPLPPNYLVTARSSTSRECRSRPSTIEVAAHAWPPAPRQTKDGFPSRETAISLDLYLLETRRDFTGIAGASV